MKSFLLLITILLAGAASEACTNATINSIVRPVDPYYSNAVGSQMATALDTLGLCDENLDYAGRVLGMKFDAYYAASSSSMASAIAGRAGSLPADLVGGLGLGIISKVDLYYLQSTASMTNAILVLARAAPFHAKTFALQLLQKQDPYYAQANSYLQSAVQQLRTIANPPPPPDAPAPAPVPNPVPSSIWAFRSNSSGCENVSGPWGVYELCPRYYASVSDQQGNRVVLACKAENYGIEFRVSLAQSNWARLSRLNVQTLAFGTGSLVQSLGVPYMIARDRALMAEEPVASEVLDQLRRSNSLIINVRANSGEVNMRLNFTLKGSNAAINQLLQNCR